jgi:hypothetical protein
MVHIFFGKGDPNVHFSVICDAYRRNQASKELLLSTGFAADVMLKLNIECYPFE